MLRQRLPEARILLLGLLPREESPSARLRLEVAQVSRLIRDCADGEPVSNFFSPRMGHAQRLPNGNTSSLRPRADSVAALPRRSRRHRCNRSSGP